MIVITNGRDIVKVSNHAYDTIFKRMGFYKVGNINSQKSQEKAASVKPGPSMETIESEVQVDIPEEAEEVIPEDVPRKELSPEEVEVEKILTKPISTWTSDELKLVAKVKKIDTSSANTVKQARAIVKKALQD